MDSETSWKIDQVKNLLYLIGEKNSQMGYQYSNENYRKGRKIFKPSVVNTLLAVIIIRDLISLFISNDFIALLIGDYVHNFQYKIQWNCFFFDCYVMITMNQLMNKVNSKKINLVQMNYPGRFNDKLGSSHRMAKILWIATKSLTLMIGCAGFLFSFAFTSMNTTFIELISIGLFWCLMFSLFAAFLCEMYTWNLAYFILTAYYCKTLLKFQNDKLKLLVKSGKFIFNTNILNALRDIDILYKKIMEFNGIWSQFLFISWICLALMLSLYFIQIFFVSINMILIKIILIMGMFIVLLLITSIIISCNLVNFQLKNTYKLLTKLNASKRLIQISIRNKFKVILILRENKVFYINFSFILIVNDIYRKDGSE